MIKPYLITRKITASSQIYTFWITDTPVPITTGNAAFVTIWSRASPAILRWSACRCSRGWDRSCRRNPRRRRQTQTIITIGISAGWSIRIPACGSIVAMQGISKNVGRVAGQSFCLSTICVNCRRSSFITRNHRRTSGRTGCG